MSLYLSALIEPIIVGYIVHTGPRGLGSLHVVRRVFYLLYVCGRRVMDATRPIYVINSPGAPEQQADTLRMRVTIYSFLY